MVQSTSRDPSALANSFHARIQSMIDETAARNAETLALAGEAIAKSIADNGILHVFGSGHSYMIAMELVGRAGGFVPVNPIVDATMGWPETLPGYGDRLIERYIESYDIKEDEVVIVISNSGRNCSPIEVAKGARKNGAKIVAVTSVEMSKAFASNHPSGDRLFEIADFVLDNCGVVGDAVMDAPGNGGKTASTSTITGSFLLEMLSLYALEGLHSRGVPLPILKSNNADGGREYNQELFRRFRPRLRQPL